jgi:hypothetical protein
MWHITDEAYLGLQLRTPIPEQKRTQCLGSSCGRKRWRKAFKQDGIFQGSAVLADSVNVE